MKLITRDTDYAVRALCFIAGSTKVVPATELRKRLAMPGPFLRKILQVLNRKGLLRSRRGLGGGFELAMPADRIYLVDVAEAFQGPLELNECFFKKKVCPNRKACPLKKKIDAIEKHVKKELGSITIASLLK